MLIKGTLVAIINNIANYRKLYEKMLKKKKKKIRSQLALLSSFLSLVVFRLGGGGGRAPWAPADYDYTDVGKYLKYIYMSSPNRAQDFVNLKPESDPKRLTTLCQDSLFPKIQNLSLILLLRGSSWFN